MSVALASLLIFLIVTLGGFLQVGTGMGVGILCMMFFPMMFPFSTAVALNLGIALASNALLAWRYRKHVDWRIVTPCCLVSIAISVTITLLSLSWNPNYVKLALGVVLVILAIYFAYYSDRIRIKATARNGALAGIAGGLGNGLFGLSGPPVGLFFTAVFKENRAYLGSIQTYFLIINLVACLTRGLNHAFKLEHIPMILIGWVASFVGTWLGVRFFERLPEKLIRKLVYIAIGVSGLNAVVQSIVALRG